MWNRKKSLRKFRMPAAALFMALLLLIGPWYSSVQAAEIVPFQKLIAASEVPVAGPEPIPGQEEAGLFYGPMLVGTDLYYVDPQTQDLVRDEYRGTLYFGPDGKYTTGDEVLDTYVEGVLAAFIAEGKTRAELLRDVYVYTRDSFSYLRRNYYEVGETGWEHDEALTMFGTGRGNCYCYASVFYYLARGLGFDAEIVSGLVGSRRSPHGWVEIVVNGEPLIFDTELEMSYLKKNQKYNFFAMSYKDVPWSYVKG